ncbi:hypothetical protein SAMN03159353_103131 [Cedecea sp. NFIX57]|nr:hypothetical protein SAMN03159353_103131 [Cedecea sp. NFIX57]
MKWFGSLLPLPCGERGLYEMVWLFIPSPLWGEG